MKCLLVAVSFIPLYSAFKVCSSVFQRCGWVQRGYLLLWVWLCQHGGQLYLFLFAGVCLEQGRQDLQGYAFHGFSRIKQLKRTGRTQYSHKIQLIQRLMKVDMDFKLKGDTCIFDFLIDLDECATMKHRCQQICTNTEGSYHCSCKIGYRMEANQCRGQSICAWKGSQCDKG